MMSEIRKKTGIVLKRKTNLKRKRKPKLKPNLDEGKNQDAGSPSRCQRGSCRPRSWAWTRTADAARTQTARFARWP